MSPGLVWVVFALSLLFVGEWESRGPRRRLIASEKLRWPAHATLTAGGFVLAWAVFRIGPVAAAALAADSPYGILNRPWIPRPAAWALAVMGLDLWRYAVHIAHHRVPLLWRFHRVHHSDPDLDLSTGLRIHPVETLAIQAGHLAFATLLAPPVGAMVLAECLFNLQSFCAHANAALPQRLEGVLRRFLVTPDMHRIHHSERREDQDRNFGDLFPWWDSLFGTHVQTPSAGHSALVPGLPGLQDRRSLGLWFMLSLPFAPLDGPTDKPALTSGEV